MIGSYVTTDIKETNENKAEVETTEGDTQLEGIFYLRINGLKKEVVAQKLSKFDQDFIDQFKTEDHIKCGLDAEVNDNFSLYRFFFNKEDYSLVFVEEQYERVNIYRW